MYKSPALIEPDQAGMGLTKRRRLSSVSNKSAALTLLALKCGDTSPATSATNDGRSDDTGHLRDSVAFRRDRANSDSICSSVTHGEDTDDDLSQDSARPCGGSPKKRTFAKRESHPLMKMALTRPTLLLIAAKATTTASTTTTITKKSVKEPEFAQIRLPPEGRPMPPPPKLPNRILPAPRRKYTFKNQTQQK